eukprot:CAMPEP_0197834678 /NCGR_PEP_ID=MMETSP1437-20131217/23293_1 /TAXON_ID=49252 ORGANISM="Eucampia antarctica, Strain CCMP1452" /NCGR_SAMPLE_ID=MMETSP1437 /ASSEMBLY_ACC=CAM_ASM_001096 /LENGTH=167 /DNA_ID=CAMNT_0043439565 /DNA_START=45 /DNA_END=548 /DNA_ORIENTATION=-
MFIERNRGQVSLTIGPFPDRIGNLLFGGDSVILVNTIKAIELTDSEGGVELVSTVQLMSENAQGNSRGHSDDDRGIFFGGIWDIARGITGASSSSINPVCCSCRSFTGQQYDLDGFMRQNFNSIQKLSILIEEGDVSAYGDSGNVLARENQGLEDNEDSYGLVPLLG